MIKRYGFRASENKWFHYERENIKFTRINGEKKYILPMLPYPSGDPHMGHVKNYTINDILVRYYYLKGYSVHTFLGWDAFGLPAEMAAIKRNLSPNDWTKSNIQKMKKSFQNLGYYFNWDNEISTCDKSYYKHQQKIFIEFYKAGLIYRKNAIVNWDPVLETVLANEQVENGICWRSGAKVEYREIEQWFLNISKYSDWLLDNLAELNWPEKVKNMQTNWIGKSHGAYIDFGDLRCYTTRPEHIFGVTFLAVGEKTAGKYGLKADGTEFREHPITKQPIPIYKCDFVYDDYGTGVVMGVPSTDERDRKFALANGIKIINIINKDNKLENSLFLIDLDQAEAQEKLKKYFEFTTQYKLRDWCVSRQRYWGCPIPFIHCDVCGVVPAEETVELPLDVDFNGSGNPLGRNEAWVNTRCPKCGIDAKRETDTMDTFVDSSWYFMRYLCAHNEESPFDENVNLMPVDIYIGGIEHAILHLLYARFFVKALKDIGMIHSDEIPFNKLICQGMVCCPTYRGVNSGKYFKPSEVEENSYVMVEGIKEEVIVGPSVKMSKSLNNVVEPDELVENFGADALKLFIVSDTPVEMDFHWNNNALFGAHKFINRVYQLAYNVKNADTYGNDQSSDDKLIKEVDIALYQIDQSISKVLLNVYVAQIRSLVNKFEVLFAGVSKEVMLSQFKRLLITLWPITPALSYECYDLLYGGLITSESWDMGAQTGKMQRMIIQVNGGFFGYMDYIDNQEEAILNATKLVNKGPANNVIFVPSKVINLIYQ